MEKTFSVDCGRELVTEVFFWERDYDASFI